MQIAFCMHLAILWIAWVSLCHALSREGSILLNFSKRFYIDSHGAFHNWNSSDQTPCAWRGIICDAGGLVRLVNLSNQFLAGPLHPELAQISTIQVLLLARNSLNGSIPQQLGNLAELTILDLSHNNFTGKVPSSISNASSITKLYLNHNSLEGCIPDAFGNLRKLRELRLDRNSLSGEIPGTSTWASGKVMHLDRQSSPNHTQPKGLCLLNDLQYADFAFNYFTGPLPSCLHGSLSLQWNCFDIDRPRQRPPGQCGQSASEALHGRQLDKHHLRWKRHLQSALVAGAFLSLLLALGLFFRYRHSAVAVAPSKSGYFDVMHPKANVAATPAIARSELEVACEDFSNIIGTSSNGTVYKGTLPNGTEIAVTEVEICSWSKDLESYFRYKVDRLAKANHKHVVKLVGYCAEEEPFTRMLVFEYTPNGTLFDLLHNCDAEQLDWNARMRIIMGVAYGLEYLHHNLSPPAGYAKFDSSCVYLTEDNAAKLADFDVGKCPVGNKCKEKPYMNDLPLGFDYIERNFQDFEANIFGFGILLLELISGRPPYCKEMGSIIDWAAVYLGNHDVIAYMVDPVLRFFDYNQLESLCEITRLCIGANSSGRPNMKVVTSMLENALGITLEAACPKQSPLLWAELAILTQM